jgi:hypothetical protein
MNRFQILKEVFPFITDTLGRIVQLKPGSNCHGGHSACNECGEDMPRCWDTVCYKCLKTFCYTHSYVVGGYWFCYSCRKSLGTDFQILKGVKPPPSKEQLEEIRQKIWA